MCFIWPRKALQTLILPFEQFLLNSSLLSQPVLWNVSWQNSSDLELFSPHERDRSLGTSLGSSHWALADGTQWLLLDHEMQLTRSRLQHPGSDPGNGLALYHTAKEPFHLSTWQFVLAVRSAVPCFLYWKEWSGRRHPTGCWLDSPVVFYFLHALK